jgi:hypothetical protein
MDSPGNARAFVTVTATESLTIPLIGDHGPDCAEFARPLYVQLAGGAYDRCSVLPAPAGVDEWRGWHRTARKRADRAERLGYIAGAIRRHERADEIHAINLSTPDRQGRPMADSYRTPPSREPLPAYPCIQHAIRTYGVEGDDGVLVGYLTLYRSGDLALVSQILGHADHLRNDVMFLLFQAVVAIESIRCPGGWFVYNRHDSGTDGLRFFKERLGFREATVEWIP